MNYYTGPSLGHDLKDISPDFQPHRASNVVVSRIIRKAKTPQAVKAFATECHKLSDYWYWFVLGTLWVDYTGWSDLQLWKHLFSSNRPNRASSLMKPSELHVFNQLPEVITAGPKGGGMAAVDVTLEAQTGESHAQGQVSNRINQHRDGREDPGRRTCVHHPSEGQICTASDCDVRESAVSERRREGSGECVRVLRHCAEVAGRESDKGEAAGLIAPYTVPNLGERDGQAPRSGSVDAPMPTITSKGNGARLVTAHLATLNHGGDEHRSASVTEPIATITGANDARALVSALITKHYGDRGQRPASGMDEPLSTVTSSDHNALTVAYLSQMYGTNKGGQGDLNEPAATITGSSNHATLVAAFLDTYYGNSKDGGSLADPAPTVVSKDRISLVTVVIDGTTYVITDIAMRMLTPRELLLAQGFPADYRVDVTADGERVSKADQVKLIGNSVCPPVARALTLANVVASGVLDECEVGK